MSVPTTVYTTHTTEIPGLLIFDIEFPGDERGYYQENFQKEKLVAAGMPADFNVVQVNVSYNKLRGVTRGFHAEPWAKYLSMVKGRNFVAFVDLRAGPTFGKTVCLEIDNTKAVFLPAGVGNSFQTLDDDSYYLYSVNAHWTAEAYDKYTFANLSDKTIGIEWPIPLEQATLSERDRNHPMLNEIKAMELS